MQINVCTAKIHRATVTQADLNYVGSITIDSDILTAAGILPFQMVQITNCANGTLWRTYAMSGEPRSGVICLNGPPARHFQPGDQIIVLAEAQVDLKEFAGLVPKVVFVDGKNKVIRVEQHQPSGFADK